MVKSRMISKSTKGKVKIFFPAFTHPLLSITFPNQVMSFKIFFPPYLSGNFLVTHMRAHTPTNVHLFSM